MLTENLRALREDADLSQKKVAEFLQITQQQYQLYESGKRELPIHHLTALCRFYGVSADYLLSLPTGLKWPRKP